MVTVKEVTEMSQEIADAFTRLVPQLSSHAKVPTYNEVAEIVASDACKVLVAFDEDGTILGTMTLVVFRIPTGIRSWVEDVVVDNTVRGKGVGEALIRASIERAKIEGAKTIDLTSRPSREAANRLYRRCGFEPRETNIYRLNLED